MSTLMKPFTAENISSSLSLLCGCCGTFSFVLYLQNRQLAMLLQSWPHCVFLHPSKLLRMKRAVGQRQQLKWTLQLSGTRSCFICDKDKGLGFTAEALLGLARHPAWSGPFMAAESIYPWCGDPDWCVASRWFGGRASWGLSVWHAVPTWSFLLLRYSKLFLGLHTTSPHCE